MVVVLYGFILVCLASIRLDCGNKLGIQGILFLGQFLVFFVIQQLIKTKVGDEQGKSNLIYFVVSALIFLVVGCIALFAFS